MMLPQPPSPASSPMTPTGAPPAPAMPGGAGAPPMGGGPPGQDQGPLDLSKVPQPLRDILGRQDKAVASLMPPRKPSLLSPEEQQAKYQAMTRDTTWATTMAATATDPAAKYWLGLIGKYGWTGIKDYLVAMQGGGP